MAKILVTEKISENALKKLSEKYTVDIKTGLSKKELMEMIKNYEAVIMRSGTKIDADVIKSGKNLKIIARAGIGVDNIDIDAATKAGIIVANAPESNIISAAEHTMALLLTQCRNIPQANSSLKSGVWERAKFEGMELDDKKLGIIGFGKVGTQVAKMAQGFGMKVLAYDPYVSKERFSQYNVKIMENLEDLLKEVDIISIHLPKTAETHSLIGKKEFAIMKDGVRLINTARGGIINEKDLIQALKNGKVAGACIDVFDNEPCTENPLFNFDNVVVTPHLGASTIEAQEKVGETITEQVIAALEGEFVINAVNIVSIPTEISNALKPYLPLCEYLGKFYPHLVEERIDALEIEYAGDISSMDTGILTIAVLKGMLEKIVFGAVTYVNTPILVREMGINVRETKTSKSVNYTNLITIRGKSPKGDIAIGGTLIGKKNTPRFVQIYDFEIDMAPSKYIAFFRYPDIPGMIGKVGTILGKHKINIANMEVGRKKIHGEAVMGVNIDTPIPEDIMEEIKKTAGITEAWYIVL